MSVKMLNFGDVALVTQNSGAHVTTDEGTVEFDLKDLGDIAEWLAVAWENLAGERYQPVIISERGYVVDTGDAVEIATHLSRTVDLERDCE